MDPESEKIPGDPSHAESIKALEKRYERLAQKDEPNEEELVKYGEAAKEGSPPSPKPMVVRKTWEEFRDAGLLWWVNRVLHLLGWAIVNVQEGDGSISDAYPARVRFRGFGEKNEEEGFRKVTRFLNGHAPALLEETEE